MRTGEGLTPIDFMVVVAVIAVLTATLMPAIQRAKEQRNMIECLANLRRWNPIISTYVEGNDGKFFSGHGTEGSWWILNIPLLVEALSLDVRPQAHQGPAADETIAWGASQMGLCSINRHVGFENVSFCDFSARKVGLKELWTLKWHRTFDTTGPWTKAGGVEASNWPQWIRPLKDY